MRAETEPVEGEDFYTEGAAVVFTARYHLRRGYCCGNGCRHCPYAGGGRAAVSNHEKNAVEKQTE